MMEDGKALLVDVAGKIHEVNYQIVFEGEDCSGRTFRLNPDDPISGIFTDREKAVQVAERASEQYYSEDTHEEEIQDDDPVLIQRVKEVFKKAFDKLEIEECEYPQFYTGQEWRDRGEEYCRGALLVVTFEGTFNHVINNHHPPLYPVIEEMEQELKELGVMYEMGTSWFLGIYRLLSEEEIAEISSHIKSSHNS